jgi:hypothetical protein
MNACGSPRGDRLSPDYANGIEILRNAMAGTAG